MITQQGVKEPFGGILSSPPPSKVSMPFRRILSTKLKVSLATFDSVIGLFCFSMMGLFGLVTNAGFGAIRSNGLGYLQHVRNHSRVAGVCCFLVPRQFLLSLSLVR